MFMEILQYMAFSKYARLWQQNIIFCVYVSKTMYFNFLALALNILNQIGYQKLF